LDESQGPRFPQFTSQLPLNRFSPRSSAFIIAKTFSSLSPASPASLLKARHIAAILLMQEALDENYRRSQGAEAAR
jgi:phospholipid N-methyltransferase